MKVRSKIWLGLGTVAIAGAAMGAVADARSASIQGAAHHQHGPAPSTVLAAQQGGEGGEGGEKGTAPSTLAPNLKFYRDVSLIRGHLLVGDELVRQERWADALPHFLHPAEEIYGGIKNDLRTYNVRPFEAALKALAQTVKAKNKEAYAGALKLVQDQLVAADTGLKAIEKDWDRFVVDTALETLHQAADEYGESIEKGRFTKAVEYQDARGFVWQAEGLIESIAPALEAKDAQALATLRADLAELKKAWPSTIPPKKPVKDQSAVLGDIARVELHAGGFF
jgi:hypothetical protein